MTAGRVRVSKRPAHWLLAGWFALGVIGAHAANRPNIVVLVADDWGFSDVGAFGGEIATPHLDALALRGMRFTNFHVAASCAPTRSMLLTGVDNHKAGIGNLRESMPQAHVGKPGYLGSLNNKVVTIATLLQDSGYRTYVTGKWNVGSEPHNLPNRRGFERSLVQGDTGSDNWDPAQRYLPHSATVSWFEDGKKPVMPTEFYSSAFFVSKAIDYIRSGEKSGKPFFAYVGFQANHVPVQAPKAFIDKYRGRYDSGWTALRQARRDKAIALGIVPKDTAMVTMKSSADWAALSPKDKQYQARLMEVYAAMADAMDHEVGRLVAHLKASGEYDNTVFVFLSDNGPEASDYADARLWLMTQYSRDFNRLGGKGAYAVPGPGWASASAAPLANYKFYAGEGGLRVPLIVSGVAGMAHNQLNAALAHVTDIVPTLLDIAQVAKPGASYQGRAIEPMTGRSLLPVLTGAAPGNRGPGDAIGYELSGNAALFKGDMKLVKNLPPVGDNGWRLYNLRTDPGETQDLQQQLPELFRTMLTEYEAWSVAHGVLPMPEGYQPARQVMINTFVNHWIPEYRNTALAGLGVVLGLVVLLVARRRSR